MVIKSETNTTYKYINKLKQKKYRNKFNRFIVESKKIVDEISDKNITEKVDIEFVFVNEDNKDYKTNEKKIVFSNSLFDKLSSMKNPQGVSAVVKNLSQREVSSDKILLVDNLQDPGNMGTIIRCAEAFDFKDIILFDDCVDIYNPKTLRASMGSIFRINIKKLTEDDLIKLKKTYKLLAADMNGIDLKDFKSKDKFILAIGNEANGISDTIRNLTDEFLSIKMKGHIESLNAAIAASIMMNSLSL